MKTTVVDTLPEQRPGGRRESPLAELVRLAARTAPKYIEITDETPDALNRLYKAMIQYRIRHPELGIQLRKQGDRFYLWTEPVRHNTTTRMAPKAPQRSPVVKTDGAEPAEPSHQRAPLIRA